MNYTMAVVQVTTLTSIRWEGFGGLTSTIMDFGSISLGHIPGKSSYCVLVKTPYSRKAPLQPKEYRHGSRMNVD